MPARADVSPACSTILPSNGSHDRSWQHVLTLVVS